MEQHQITLDYKKNALPLAHRDDPITSYEAADKMIESGKLSRRQEEVYQAIIETLANSTLNTFTPKFIALWSGVDYHEIQRRLNELRQKSKIERTGEKRDGCCVWRLK